MLNDGNGMMFLPGEPWRVEIKKYPLLTQKGSRRRKTNFGIIPHGGYYTQEEVREVVA